MKLQKKFDIATNKHKQKLPHQKQQSNCKQALQLQQKQKNSPKIANLQQPKICKQSNKTKLVKRQQSHKKTTKAKLQICNLQKKAKKCIASAFANHIAKQSLQ